MGEFELIQRYFRRPPRRADVPLGSGDDCALLRVPDGQLLAVSTDTLVSGVHFFADVAPEALGHKALAVNLSDLAAMGAAPCWASLALTLPAIDEPWVAAFARGFLALAGESGVDLVGGDITRGPLSITVTVHGTVPPGQALLRGGARPGDALFVTGQLGDASLCLQHLLGELTLSPAALAAVRPRLERPQPRLAAGLALRNLASSALDISDGLSSDLAHILAASGVAAEVDLARLPLSDTLRAAVSREQGWALAVAGGDDYELCFTVPAGRRDEVAPALAASGIAAQEIGRIVAGAGEISWLYQGRPQALGARGWDHFKEQPHD